MPRDSNSTLMGWSKIERVRLDHEEKHRPEEGFVRGHYPVGRNNNVSWDEGETGQEIGALTPA